MASEEPAGGLPLPSDREANGSELRYIEGMLARGEAVPEGHDVPDEATHKLTRDERGHFVLHRRHFSAF